MRIDEWTKKYADINLDLETAQRAVSEFQRLASENPVILYGAGIVGKRFAGLLKEIGITTFLHVDKNYIDLKREDDVVIIEDPSGIQWDSLLEQTIVIASMNRNYHAELQKELSGRGFCGILQDGQSLYSSLRSAKCVIDVENGILHDQIDCHDCVIIDNVCIPRRDSFLKKYGEENANHNGSQKMWMIGYIMGQYCSLNCKHCCEAIPYYSRSQRAFADKETVLNDIKHMASACRFLTTIEFVGGEPFLHPQIQEILSEVIKIKNAGKVHVFTNGTVPPSNDLCELLSDDRFEITISNYQITLNDAFQKKVSETYEKLQNAGCNVLFGRRQGWLDFASFDLECSDEEEVKKRYHDCFIHTCNRLFNGVLYHCPHEYAGALLGHFDSHSDILHIHDYTTEQLAKKLDEYKERDFFESCKYCKLPYDAEPVVSGIQEDRK